MVAPAGPMYQAGTLSGNPLAMTAGIKVRNSMFVACFSSGTWGFRRFKPLLCKADLQ